MVFLDAAERRYVEELGGMNMFFVFDDGSLATPPLDGTILAVSSGPFMPRVFRMTVTLGLSLKKAGREVGVQRRG